MQLPAHRRHDISDRVWNILEPLLPGRKGSLGRPSQDNRRFINAVFWIIRTGAPWRDPVSSTGQALPLDYGDWKNTHRRYSRWRDNGVWERLLEALIDEPDFEWLMIDASYVKVHAHGVPVRMKITEGTASDSSLALELIDGIDAEHLLADKGYDSDAVVSGVLERGIKPVIPRANIRCCGN